ncbi:MAG: hypothetical protein HKN19_11860, partial [Halioglobus sp.]|nr:hypothetical protein [Halioglobus sp.]
MDIDKMDAIGNFALRVLEISALVFVFVLGTGVLALLYMYLADTTQTRQAIRRNYP